MQLSNIIGRAIDLNTRMGITYQKKAVAAAVDLLRGDDEATDEARYVAASKLIHDQATKSMRQVAEGDQRQGSFFALRARYALDVDARVFKDTEQLTELEFDRLIAIREKQLSDDAAHLNKLVEARREVRPIWREYPDKTFGEVEAIYLRRLRNGNGHAAA